MRLEVFRHAPRAPILYSEIDRYQRQIAQQLEAEPESPGRLLLFEPSPVITYGRRTNLTEDLKLPRESIERAGVSLYEVDRGGYATYHGPGQWVLFPVERLERLVGDPKGIKRAICALLEVARGVAEALGHEAEIREGAELGVWSRGVKVASVGIHVGRGVVLHGVSINGFVTPQSFMGFRPCGLDCEVGYLIAPGAVPDAARLEAAFLAMGEVVLAQAGRVFGEWGAKIETRIPATGASVLTSNRLDVIPGSPSS